MPKAFNTIGLIGRVAREGVLETLKTLINFLQARQISIILEKETSAFLQPSLSTTFLTIPKDALATHCDLIISVGGDGNLLGTARIAAPANTPILGINRGKLGFLTDIRPNEIAHCIDEILEGQFKEEKRFMLNANIMTEGKLTASHIALNDIILSGDHNAHMLEFEIHVNDDFMCSQQSDGVIVATPTGSTAYALSGGGPIVHPNLNAIVMVPMFPHTLSQRPIVLDGDSQISIKLPNLPQNITKIISDGQDSLPIPPNSTIEISKNEKKLRLIHPLSYNYFETLRGKLYWGQKLH